MMTEQAGWVTVPAPRWNKIHVNAVKFTSTSWKLMRTLFIWHCEFVQCRLVQNKHRIQDKQDTDNHNVERRRKNRPTFLNRT